MTTECRHTTPWPWVNRPRDYMRDTIDLTFEDFDFGGGPLPRSILVWDHHIRACWYRATDMLILEPITKRMRLSYATYEHSWDNMPQILVVRDTNGNSGVYEPEDPREAKPGRMDPVEAALS